MIKVEIDQSAYNILLKLCEDMKSKGVEDFSLSDAIRLINTTNKILDHENEKLVSNWARVYEENTKLIESRLEKRMASK